MSVDALRRLPRSLGVRLVLMFFVLALALSVVFTAGMQRAMGGGWRALVRPLVADYVDRLAAEIGSPPDIGRAQALVQRLPLSVRIEGPVVQWDSHPHLRDADGRVRPLPPSPWHMGGPPFGGHDHGPHRHGQPDTAGAATLDDDAPRPTTSAAGCCCAGSRPTGMCCISAWATCPGATGRAPSAG